MLCYAKQRKWNEVTKRVVEIEHTLLLPSSGRLGLFKHTLQTCIVVPAFTAYLVGFISNIKAFQMHKHSTVSLGFHQHEHIPGLIDIHQR